MGTMIFKAVRDDPSLSAEPSIERWGAGKLAESLATKDVCY